MKTQGYSATVMVACFPTRCAWRRVLGACVLMASTATLASAQVVIPQSGWTLQSVDSQEPVGYAATNAFDGNANTMWTSQWQTAAPPPPHDIRINLGSSHPVSGFRYLPRQDGSSVGRIAQYEFYVSADGTNWGTAVATGTFSNTATEQQVLFTTKTGQYVRLRALSEVSGLPYTAVAEINVLETGSQPPVVPQAGWTLLSVDSQEPVGYAATNAFDGNPNTMWTSQWQSAAPPPPHDIRINLGSSYALSGFRYLPRQDGSSVGRIAQYEFYVSADGTNWGTAVAMGTFPNTAVEQQVPFTTKTGQYIRLRALSEVAGRPYTAVAEINVLGTGAGNQPPNGVITSPTADVTIAPGQTVTFSSTGTDPDNHLPLTFAWTFGAGGPAPSSSQNPGAVSFPTAGVYTVTLTVRDALGQPDPVPATRTVTVQSVSSLTLIPQSGWTLLFADSEGTQGENGEGTNAFDGNPNTAWVTQFVNGGPPPPHEIQIDLGASYEVTGFRYLPFQLTQAGRIGAYEFYVSADGANWGSPAAIGAFPDTNSSASRDVLFVPRSGRYIRLRALSEVNNGDFVFTALAELNVMRAGTGANQPPTVTMTSPATNLTLMPGSALALSGSGTDPEGNLPLTSRWSVGPLSGIADLAAPGIVQFDRSGTFTVTLTVSDALGRTSSVSRTVTVAGAAPIPNSSWTLLFADSQDTANGNIATHAFDGNPNTMWVTEWVSAQPPPPHELRIDLGSTHEVRGFRYLPRQDGSTVGNIAQYQFYVSSDGVNWGTPVASGLFAGGSGEQEIVSIGKSGRYVRLQALSEIHGYPYSVVAELRVLAPVCQGPSLTLGQPASRHIQTTTTLAVQADACVTAGQGVRFVVDGGAQGTDFSAPYTGSFSGLSLAEHTVEAFLIDSGGANVGGVATYDQATRVGVGGYFVAMGDGMTVGYGDDAPGDDNSADGRNMRGGYTPILSDGLTTTRGYPVAVVNEGLGSAASINGAALIQALLQKHSLARYFLVLYGHNDAQDGVPSGVGLSPGEAGYAGSFKDNIQQIITAVNAAGKRAVLAKAPPMLPVNGALDWEIQQYNMVMDELAAIPGNLTPIAAVDLYTYFLSRTGTDYQDDILPNGLGYQSMAQAWRQALAAVVP